MRPIDADAIKIKPVYMHDICGVVMIRAEDVARILNDMPTISPELCEDADKLKRCMFEYINACKIVARKTPDTSTNDIYDAYAVMKALQPIFGDEEF